MTAVSIAACSSAVPHHAGSTLMPNAGMPLSARYLPPSVNEFVMIGRTAKTFFSSTSERTVVAPVDAWPWSLSFATSLILRPKTPPALLTLSK